MRIALIGDIHFFSLKLHPRRMLSRRVLGQSNLWLNRRNRFVHAVLEPVMKRVLETLPQHVLCSGDLTTTSLESEFAKAAEVLAPVHEHTPVVVVPGNHDRYTFQSVKARRIEGIMQGMLPAAFPHVRELSPTWKLVALDSAVPNVLFSRGRLGEEQCAAFEQELGKVQPGQGVVILCHYPVGVPPGVPTAWTHDLKEDKRVRQAIADCRGRVLFLHGHIHKPWRWESRKGGVEMTCVNAGSPCYATPTYPLGQGFWELELPEDVDHRIEMLHHYPMPRNGVTSAKKIRVLGLPEIEWMAERE